VKKEYKIKNRSDRRVKIRTLTPGARAPSRTAVADDTSPVFASSC